MKKIFLFALFCFSLSVFSQEKSSKDSTSVVSANSFKKLSPALIKKEQEIKQLFAKITEQDTRDADRVAINEQIRLKIGEALKDSNSFFYPFDSLKYLGKVYSDDYNIRIYTWCCEMEDLSYKFYGFIQDFENDMIYPMQVKASPFVPKQNQVIALYNWYGALYYKAIKISSKSARDPKYILLGWNQSDFKSKNKILDVLTIEEDGANVKLGSKIFKGYNGRSVRMVLSYCADLGISLNYDEKGKRFLFDHLTPLSEERKMTEDSKAVEVSRGCNGPDMSYDSLQSKRKGKRWVLKKDVDIKNDL